MDASLPGLPQQRTNQAAALAGYALLYTAFAVGAMRMPSVVGPHMSNADKSLLAFSAIVGALVALGFIFVYSRSTSEWQHSWKRYGVLFLCGAAADVACNALATVALHHDANEYVVIGLIGIANLGMLLCAAGIGLIVAQGMRAVNYLVMAAIVGGLTDIVSVFMGPTKHLMATDAFAYLSFQWGIIGLRDVSPIVGMGDFIFIALFFTGVRRFGWDARRTLVALVVALAVGLLLTLYGPRAMPALPFLGAALLLAHAKDIRAARAAVQPGN